MRGTRAIFHVGLQKNIIHAAQYVGDHSGVHPLGILNVCTKCHYK